MGRSMDWTLKDNMVNGLLLCAHSKAAEEAIPHLRKQCKLLLSIDVNAGRIYKCMQCFLLACLHGAFHCGQIVASGRL